MVPYSSNLVLSLPGPLVGVPLEQGAAGAVQAPTAAPLLQTLVT
jgi:hypothetical protein